MTIKKSILVALALAMIGGTALVLSSIGADTRQKLGEPGLRIVATPLVDETGKVVATNSVELPSTVLNFDSKLLPLTKMELNTLPADTTFGRREYRAPDGFQLRLDAVMMGADRTSIHKPQICLTAQGWIIEKTDLVHISINSPKSYDLPLKRLIAGKTIQLPNGSKVYARAVLSYWFVAEDAITAEHGQRMWWMAKELLQKGVLQRWSYVTCLSICQPGNEEKVFERQKEFIAAAVPQFQIVPKAENAHANEVGRLDDCDQTGLLVKR